MKAKTFSLILLFVVLSVLVIFFHKLLSDVVIGQLLTFEDYGGLQFVRLYIDKIFSDPIYFWNQDILHNVSHDFYIAFLDVLFKENYDMYLYSSIFLKVLATLSLFPLVLVITKNKLLAFLSTFLFGVSYPSAGALRLYVVGNEYLGVALMNFFFVAYYYSIKRGSVWWLLFILSLMATLTFLAAPIRTYPLFIIILLVELIILVKNRFRQFIPTILRASVVFIPSVFILMGSLRLTGSGAYGIAGIPDFLTKVANGNWWLMLNPLWGLAYTFLPFASMLQLFGKLDVVNFSFSTYLIFLFQKAFIIFTLVSIVLAAILAKQKLRFFLILTSINLIADILLYVIFSHHLSIPKDLVREGGYDAFSGIYANLVASYIISVAVTCLIEWFFQGKKNFMLLLTFLSPFISLFFIISQWIFTRDYNMYREGTHRYFVIPAIGSYLFVACLIVLIYQKSKITNKIYASLANLLIFFLLLSIINISRGEQEMIFMGAKIQGLNLSTQQSMQNQAISYIPKDKLQDDLLIYIKFKSDKLGDANTWENLFDWYSLRLWMGVKASHLANSKIRNCIVMTWDASELLKMTKIQNNIKGFLYDDSGNKMGACGVSPTGQGSAAGKFIPLDHLFAFTIDQDKVIDITKQVRVDFE